MTYPGIEDCLSACKFAAQLQSNDGGQWHVIKRAEGSYDVTDDPQDEEPHWTAGGDEP